jgi:hypothetical protein
VASSTPEKIYCKVRGFIKGKKDHYIIPKDLIHQENIKAQTRAPKYTKTGRNKGKWRHS